MKPRTESVSYRRAKLPPILDMDVDEGETGMGDLQSWARPRWSSDAEEPGVSLDEWPTEYDD
jgi:hypothetical protein